MGLKIIIDFHDVVYPSTYSLYKYFIMHTLEFGEILEIKPDATLDEIEKRPTKNILNAISKEGISKKEVLFVMSKIATEFRDSNYFDLSMTNPMVKKILDSNLLMNNVMLDDITIIYPYYSDKERTNIENYIYSIKNSKTKMLAYDGRISRESYILKKLDWNIFITDNRKLVKKIIEDKSYDITNKEFYMSGRSYSKLASAEEILIGEKGGKISYY